MSIFGPQTQAPTRINQVKINQSVLGYALPVVMGRGKVQQSILWLDGFSSQLITTGGGGKGFGGGKGGNQYIYSADVIAALCNGGATGIIGIGDVWSGQSWLQNALAVESTVITSGLTYTPTNAGSYTAGMGVGVSTAYSGTFNDLGANVPTNLSGTHLVSFLRVPFGSSLSAGQYFVNPATNQYTFSSANIGQTVTLFYSFALATVTRQEVALIPSGLNVAIDGNIPFASDGGVRYYTGAKDGQPLQLVSGTPTVTGTYSVDYGSYSVSGSPGSYVVTVHRAASYSFAPGDTDAEVSITYKLDNSSALPQGTSTSVNFELYAGTPGQSVLPLLDTNFPGAALGYSGIAFVAYTPMDLGYDAQVQQNVFEVMTADGWGAGIADCNPIQCILQVLTNKVWGLGAGAVPFPAGAIDNSTAGTWGTALATGAPIQDSTASSWFAANGFFISPVIDKQDTAASLIGKWLEAGQCAAFMSEGLLKLVPYGDTSVAGNGVIWVAPTAYAAYFDDDAFIAQGKNADPVKTSSAPWQDAYNTVTVTWNNRGNQYAPEPTPESDQAAINRYGSRIEDPQAWDFITTLPAAVFAASIRVKRNVYQRNTYEFTTSYRYTNVESMDVVPLTTSSMWAAGANNPLGISALPVRITKKVDNPNGTIDWTAEDYLGVNHATPYGKGVGAGTAQPNLFADPGDSSVVFFDGPLDLKIYNGNELWIGAAGANSAWGGCYVYASTDGTKYLPIGKVDSPARLGALNAILPAHTDPDTASALVVNLASDSGVLIAGTTTDADNATTLCYVDGELLAFSACAISGVDQYTMDTYIRRGLMGTAESAHPANSQFLRLDNSVFKYAYDSSWIGKTIYLKFQSFNAFANSPQDLSACVPYTFTPGGTSYPAPPIVTVSQSSTYSGGSGSTAAGGLTTSGGVLVSAATVYVTVTWTWPANFPEPSAFNVVIFEGTDPTNTTGYIAPVSSVGASARSYTFAVTPTAAMSNVNAAVEAVYA